MEYDTERAGTFAPLRFVPKNKIVVLGLVSSKVPELESADELKRRIDEASRYFPLEQLALSPQCGFSSNIVGNLLSEDDQWRKLELIQQVALMFGAVEYSCCERPRSDNPNPTLPGTRARVCRMPVHHQRMQREDEISRYARNDTS